MAEKKKFEKPEMQVIKLKSKVHMLAGSECSPYGCYDDCPAFDPCPCDQNV